MILLFESVLANDLGEGIAKLIIFQFFIVDIVHNVNI